MNSLTYVSDPRIWEAFYKNMAEKKFNPYRYKPKQIGRGVKSYKSYVIPLRNHSQLESEENSTQVTPVAAVEERAKVEHAKDVKEGVPFVKVNGGYKKATLTIFCHFFKEIKANNISNSEEKTYRYIQTKKTKKGHERKEEDACQETATRAKQNNTI